MLRGETTWEHLRREQLSLTLALALALTLTNPNPNPNQASAEAAARGLRKRRLGREKALSGSGRRGPTRSQWKFVRVVPL